MYFLFTPPSNASSRSLVKFIVLYFPLVLKMFSFLKTAGVDRLTNYKIKSTEIYLYHLYQLNFIFLFMFFCKTSTKNSVLNITFSLELCSSSLKVLKYVHLHGYLGSSRFRLLFRHIFVSSTPAGQPFKGKKDGVQSPSQSLSNNGFFHSFLCFVSFQDIT